MSIKKDRTGFEPVESELLEALRIANTDLLGYFARSPRNKLRADIRQFQSQLLRLRQWARDRNFLALASKAQWWRWHWYEREYGDSRFEPFNDTNTQTSIPFDSAFWHNVVLLDLVILGCDASALGFELETISSISSSRRLSIIPPTIAHHTWELLTSFIETTNGGYRDLFLDSILVALENAPLAKASPGFLNFLTSLPNYFCVTIQDRFAGVLIRVNFHDTVYEFVSEGRLHQLTSDWLVTECVRQEAESNISNFTADLMAIWKS